MSRQNDQTVYAAAQGREFLRDALEGKENRYINEFAGLIDDPETLDLLNYYCSLYQDVGRDFLDSRLGEIIVRNAATRTTDRAYREGNVSQLQGMVGLTDNSRDGNEAFTEAAQRLADEGAIYLVLGPPGAGKTAFALDVCRVWGALTGGTVLSNVSWDGADEVVTDSETMLSEMAAVDGQVLQLIDEAGQTLTSRGSEQQVTDQFAKSLKYVRKKQSGDRFAKQGSVLLIGHTDTDTAAEIRRLASGAFLKPSRNDQGWIKFMESVGGVDTLEEVTEFKGVTDTRENYSEHEASRFRVVTPDDDGEDDAPDLDDVRREDAIAAALKAVRPWDDDGGMKYADAGEIVGYSETWVGNRVDEWRRGKHRETVERPERESA